MNIINIALAEKSAVRPKIFLFGRVDTIPKGKATPSRGGFLRCV